MKNIQHSIGLLLLLALVACGGGVTSDQDASEGAVRTLTVGETQTSFISVDGEVDTYRLRAAENQSVFAYPLRRENIRFQCRPAGDCI
jgi:ABC-type glycerol-3-phosphate transport system substrate-binding protein